MRRRDLFAVAGGATITWATAALAQQKTIPVIGFLNGVSAGPYAAFVAEFRKGLNESGYVEGQNLTIEYRWAEGRYDRLPALAAELVNLNVDLIAASGGPLTAVAAKHATSTLPIVFISGDPVSDGVVSNLARPGGNLTGVSFLVVELHPKRLELLSELVPQARVMALLVNSESPQAMRVIGDMEEAARAKQLQLDVLKASTEDEIGTAFAAIVQRHAGGVVVQGDPVFNSRRDQLVSLAARHAVPAIYQGTEFTAAGGLMSYGSSLPSAYRQLGIYAGTILKGAKPADLPVLQPTKFELVINLKTAKALDLAVPQSLLQRADEVIE